MDQRNIITPYLLATMKMEYQSMLIKEGFTQKGKATKETSITAILVIAFITLEAVTGFMCSKPQLI